MAGDKNLDDILASIRKIVVEDPATEAPMPEPDIDDALLDPDFDSLPLTELVEEPPAALPTEAGIDATARALLQPMLQAWLDANLPEIVEAAVAAEIKRLTGHG
jgi:cell pole-organizing protein PopZ